MLNILFRYYYGPAILHPVSKVVIMLWYLIYISVSIYGLSIIKTGINPTELVVDDHFSNRWLVTKIFMVPTRMHLM